MGFFGFGNKTEQDYINQGKRLQNAGNYVDAIKAFEKAYEFDSENIETLSGLGVSHKKVGDAFRLDEHYEIAKEYYNAAMKIDKENELLIINAGSNYIGLHDFKNALKCFNKVLKINPNSIIAYLNRGIVYNWEKEYSKAAKDFDYVIQNAQTESYINLAKTHKQIATEEKPYEA